MTTWTEYDINVGETWTRERDGMVAKVETVDPGSHGYVRWRPIDGGRLRWNWKWEFATGWARSNPVLEAINGARAALLRGEVAGVLIDTDSIEPMDDDDKDALRYFMEEPE